MVLGDQTMSNTDLYVRDLSNEEIGDKAIRNPSGDLTPQEKLNFRAAIDAEGGTGSTIAPQTIRDIISAMLLGGTNTGVTLTYNQAAGTMDIVVTGSGGNGQPDTTRSDREIRDVAAALITGGADSGIRYTYDAQEGTISATVTATGGGDIMARTDRQIRDVAAAMMTSGADSGISFIYNAAAGSVTATVTGGGGGGGTGDGVVTFNLVEQHSQLVGATSGLFADTGFNIPADDDKVYVLAIRGEERGTTPQFWTREQFGLEVSADRLRNLPVRVVGGAYSPHATDIAGRNNQLRFFGESKFTETVTESTGQREVDGSQAEYYLARTAGNDLLIAHIGLQSIPTTRLVIYEQTGTVSVPANTMRSDADIRNVAAAMLVGGTDTGISYNYDATSGTISATVTGGMTQASQQAIQDAIAALPADAANKFQVKYVQTAEQAAIDAGTVNLMASRMNMTHNLIGIAGNEFRIEVLPDNTRFSTDLDAISPFMTDWDGFIDILATGAGPQSYLSVIQRVTHFVGETFEFANERELHERMLATFDIGIPLSGFNSATPLSQGVIDRFAMLSNNAKTMAFKLELIFRLFSDAARTQAKNFNLLTSFNVSFNQAGLLYHQASKKIGPKGEKGDQGDSGTDAEARTPAKIGSDAFKNPPDDLDDTEKEAVRSAINAARAGEGGGGETYTLPAALTQFETNIRTTDLTQSLGPNVRVNPGNVAQARNVFLSNRQALAVVVGIGTGIGVQQTLEFKNQAVTFSELAGGILTLNVLWQATSFSSPGLEIVSYTLDYGDGVAFTFPVPANLRDATGQPGDGATISIPIRNVDYSAKINTQCTVRLAYIPRSASFNGSFTINSVTRTLDGPLRLPVRQVATEEANIAKAAVNTRIDGLGDEFNAVEGQFTALTPQLNKLIDVPVFSPVTGAYFYESGSATDFRSDLTMMIAVNPENPQYTATEDERLYVAVPQTSSGPFFLRNISTGMDMALDNAGSSFTTNGTSYFVYQMGFQDSDDVFEVEDRTVTKEPEFAVQIAALTAKVAMLEAQNGHLFDISAALLNVLRNEVTVTVQDNVTREASDYNKMLGTPNTDESVSYQQGTQASNISDAFNMRASGNAYHRRKLAYLPSASMLMAAQNILAAMVGGTTTILMSTDGHNYLGKKFIPAVPQGSQTVTHYPSPSNSYGGPDKYHRLPASVLGPDGLPIEEASEKFFTLNLPTVSKTLTIRSRGYGNNGIFGAATNTLDGVGGSADVSTTIQISTGAETVQLLIEWYAATRRVRASITERVSGEATVRYVEVNLSWTKAITIPATPATVRNVNLGAANDNETLVVAISAASDGNLLLTTSSEHLNTGYSFTALFGGTEAGTLQATGNDSQIFDFRGFDPSEALIAALVDRAGLPGYGLFDDIVDHNTIVAFDTQLKALNASGTLVGIGEGSGSDGGDSGGGGTPSAGGAAFTTVYNSKITLSSSTWRDTGWDIPTSGDKAYFFAIKGFPGSSSDMGYFPFPGLVSGSVLRATGTIAIGSSSNPANGAFVDFEGRVGDAKLARHPTLPNRLIMSGPRSGETTLIIYEIG